MVEKLEKLQKTTDRISSLPNEVITCILSFLPTKDVVKTSVLSRRWKPIWTCVPILDLSEMDFYPKQRKLGDVKRLQPIFLAFIYEFLLQGKFSRITRFRLRCLGTYDEPVIRSWVHLAKKKNVQELDINVSFYETSLEEGTLHMCLRKASALFPDDNNLSYTGSLNLATEDMSIIDSWMCVVAEWGTRDLHLHLSTKKMLELPLSSPYDILVGLTLNSVSLNFPTASLCFPKLKVLHLSFVKFVNGSLAADLISSSCPMLEELKIYKDNRYHVQRPLIASRDNRYNVQRPLIASRTLRRLTIFHYGRDEERVTVIDAPNLQYLVIYGNAMGGYVFKDSTLLEKAKLECEIDNECLHQLLKKINSIRCLSLSNTTMQSLSDFGFGLPIFENLTCLEILYDSDYKSIRWDLMEAFLENSPMLTTFAIDLDGISFEPDSLQRNVPSCLESKLEKFEVFDCRFNDKHLRFIEYILKNSKVLKKVKIQFSEFLQRDQIKAAVQEFPMASSPCFIEFSSTDLIWPFECDRHSS